MNQNILRQLGFNKEVNNYNAGLCAACGNEVDKFKDNLSEREYGISGMCQKCQDEVFG